MATQDDVAFDDIIMEKYHLKDQGLSLEKLYLARKICFRKQASYDYIECKSKSMHIYIWQKDSIWVTTTWKTRSHLEDYFLLKNKIFMKIIFIKAT